MSEMKVGRYNYPHQLEGDLEGLLGDIRAMLVDGRYILSAEVTAFEEQFAAYVGTRFCRGVNTGTDAIMLALMSLGLRPGDEVVTQANTFNATVAAIYLAGGAPVLVDAEEDSYLI